MGQIPVITSQISAKSARTQGSIDAYANPNAFGAQVGNALQGAGVGVSNLGEALRIREEKKANETAANAVAQADFTPEELQARNEVGPDGAGLRSHTLEKFDAWVDDKANAIDNDLARTKFRNDMARYRNQVSSRSATQEFTLDAAWSKTQADASLMALENKIRSDPSMYDEYITQGNAVLDTRTNMPANMREGMKLAWQQKSANARFDGMLEGARSVADIDAASSELTATQKTTKDGKDDYAGRDWSKELTPQDYETLLNKMGTARKEFITKADADARAALDTIEERAKDINAELPREEMKAVGSVVKQSRNPVTLARYARIVRDQDIIQENRGLPLAEQRAAINAAKGDPTTQHPGVPARVSTAINTATSRFDVSASYLSSTAVKEYGQYFKRVPRPTNKQFTPVATRGDVDLRNVRPDVAEAATVAGELFGSPLQITSGYRSQQKQDGIRANGDPNRASVAKHSNHTEGTGLDISIAGMSNEAKGKLAASLVDAGFTGIGEYDTHIHADFRASVPASFRDDRGGTWGGWTYLSPSVAEALKQRGFGAGKSASEIQRSSPVQYADNIDYGKGTSLTKDDGRPASDAMGIGQFIPSTFLGLMRDPKTAARIGVDTSNMSDAQVLELRKDPEVSMLASAALAEQNKKTLTNALGRSVDDAELYMAHFLGAGGAIALLNAQKQRGDQSAAALLPDAAASNRKVFYNGNKPRTVDEVYNQLSREFVAAPSKTAYDDVQTRQRVLDATEKALKDNPIQHAKDVGSHNVPEFTVDNMALYGQTVRSIADYYNMPISDMKVLSDDAEASMKKVLEDGTADDTLNVLTAMQNLGGDVARAALKQLGEKDNVYAFAGSMNLETGNSAVSADIVRGQKRLSENPALKEEVGANDKELSQAFRLATGNALNEVSPKVRQDMQDAALAYYAETVLARGKGAAFDQKLYANAVQAVLGNDKNAPSVGVINGEQTVLPAGVDAHTMEKAMSNMTVVDWAEMSKDGTPPRYITGGLIQASDLADEAKLRAIGGGEYTIQLDDGTFATTGNPARNGRMEYYTFTPDPKKINEISKRAVIGAVRYEDGDLPPDDTGGGIRSLMMGESEYDENGRWVGPSTGGGTETPPFNVDPMTTQSVEDDPVSGLSGVERTFMAALRTAESAGVGGTAVRLYNDIMQRGRTKPITEGDFSADERQKLRDLVIKTAKGKTEGKVDYKDYPGSGVDSNILGGFKYQIKDGTVHIEDTYDFNANRADGYEDNLFVQALAFVGNPRGLAASIGRKKLSDLSGKGIPVRIKL